MRLPLQGLLACGGQSTTSPRYLVSEFLKVQHGPECRRKVRSKVLPMSRNDVQQLEFPRILDDRGNLTFLQEFDQVPFQIGSVYWIYDVPGGEEHGGSASYTNQEIIVALSGGFDVVVHDGVDEQTWALNRSYYGIHLPALTWHSLRNFSTNSVALIISSAVEQNETDSIREFSTFCGLVRSL